MGPLDAEGCALLPHEAGDTRQGLRLRVVPKAEVVLGDAASGSAAVASAMMRPMPPVARVP